MPLASIAEIDLETVVEESEEAFIDMMLGQRKSNFVFQNQAHNAQRRTAQRIRIFRAGWLFINRPKAHKRVEFIG